MAGEPRDTTRLLDAVNAGDEDAWSRLVPFLYAELHGLAAELMRAERRGHTLQPTALVHEVWIRLLGSEQAQWQNTGHFLAAAAKAMRRLLVDHARRRKACKRGGREGQPVSLDEEHDRLQERPAPEDPTVDLEALDSALEKLVANEIHRGKCQIIELHCFAGLTLQQTAQTLKKPLSSVKRDWTFAKAWLYRELTKDEEP